VVLLPHHLVDFIVHLADSVLAQARYTQLIDGYANVYE
jgi:hypothetical protein